MSRFKFWKKSESDEPDQAEPVTITRFNVTPRQDVGSASLPADPEAAERLTRLRRRREALQQEVQAAQDAMNESNRWRTEIALIEQAVGEIDADIDALPASGGPAGMPPDPIAVELRSFEQDPVVSLTFQIGDETFVLAEDLDWAERGFQLARSDLHLDEGDVARLTSDEALKDHLISSLIVYATAVRDHKINGEDTPDATLLDLATPSDEFGGWLDWAGHSPFAQQRNLQVQVLRAERDRLEHERETLIADEARTAESLPFAIRRLAEVDTEIKAVTGN